MSYKYDYITFEDIFESAQEFEQAYPQGYQEYGPLTTAELDVMYMLLNARYATSKTFMSETRFKERCMSLVFQFGPKLIKDLEIQKRLRELEEDDLLKGAVQKTTAGYNPSTDIDGNTDTEISTVNTQNLMKYTKGILDGYTNLLVLLKNDISSRFLNKFKTLFVSVIDIDDIEEDE